MMARLVALAALTAVAAAAQNSVIRAWFRDGAGIELRTETEGATGQTTIWGGGRIALGVVSRLVSDGHDSTIFGYDFEAQRAAEPGAIDLRIRPLSENPDHVPTVSAVRQFLGVKIGQEVKLEILEKTPNGERVYDVLRPIDLPGPAGGGPTIEAVPKPALNIHLTVNGKALVVNGTWFAGKTMRLYVPGQGMYYLAWESRPQYRMAGYVEKNRLVFFMDSVYVEITGGHNLAAMESGPVWVYHDAGFVSAAQEADLSAASSAERRTRNE